MLRVGGRSTRSRVELVFCRSDSCGFISVRKLLVFPGMHGSKVLLEDFKQHAPDSFDVQLLELPESIFDYPSLAEHFRQTVIGAGPCVVMGESFSGPLSVLLASQCENVEALVMAASFVTPPSPWIAKFLPWRLLMSIPPSKEFVARFLLEIDRKQQLVETVYNEIRSRPVRAMAGRMRVVTRVDVREALARVTCPVLYLRAKNDWLVPKRCLDRVRDVCGSVEVVELSAPHLILQREPEACWNAISELCGRG